MYNNNSQQPPYPQQQGGYPNQGPGMYANNIEGDPFLSNMNSFSDVKIRHGFIRKVYAIVSLQLLVTFSFIITFVMVQPIATFFAVNYWMLYVFLFGTFIIMMVLACCESVSRKHPLNLILLSAFTIMESVLVACISTAYKTDTLLIAVGITAVIVIALTLFAFQTKIDFTGAGVYLFVFALILMLFGIVSIFMRSKILSILYASLGAGLFSMYLIFDTQLMLGGKHKYSISPEDYVIAALNIYVDIINLFLLILRLVSAAKD